jgi:carbonic anhydrase/acetyltransferase-like protein (isoleucine patch superfamily)
MCISIGQDTYIDPTAVIIGSVTIGDGASIWPFAVIRADASTVKVGNGSNIQEHVAIHVDPGSPATIGEDVSVGHGAVIHGATVGDRCIIGIHSTILNGADIGEESIIGANALVTAGMKVPPRSIVVGVPAKIIKQGVESNREATMNNALAYHRLRDEFMAGKYARYRPL